VDRDRSGILVGMLSNPMKSDGSGWFRGASSLRISRLMAVVLMVETVFSIIGGVTSARLDGEAAAGAALIFVVVLITISIVIGMYCGSRRLLAVSMLTPIVLAIAFWGSTWVYGADRGTPLGYLAAIGVTVLFGCLISGVGYARAHAKRDSRSIG
jgi:predicted membrane-bound spermidine synthase